MSLRGHMLDDLSIVKAIVANGHEVIPAWHVFAPEGEFRVLTRSDPDAPGQRDRMIHLMRRLMVWKQGTAFPQAAELWLGPIGTRSGQKAIAVVGLRWM